jgi:hypothetical protein
MTKTTRFQIKQTGWHFELWCLEPAVSKQWFFVSRRSSIRELVLLIGGLK